MENQPVCGTMYRSLINGIEVEKERKVSFEPDEVVITIYTNEKDYQEWLKRKGETVRFQLTNSNIDEQLVISNVILVVRLEEVVEIILKLISPALFEERKSWMYDRKK